MNNIAFRKSAALVMSAIFSAGIMTATFSDIAEARGGGGHGGGGHHGGHGGSHPRPPSGGHHGGHNGGHHGDYHHHGYDNWHHYDNHYGRWVAGGVAAGVTAAAIGSIIYSLPGSCYQQADGYFLCNGYYYQPQYRGSQVVYVRVR